MSASAALVAAALLVSQPGPAPGEDAQAARVSLPLTQWSALVDAASVEETQPAPPLPVAYVARSVEGTFDKGLLTGTLTTRFEVFDDRGYLQVPIIDAEASPGEVRLDGKPTSLVARDGMYTVGVERPGTYEVSVTFYRGHQQDRFARRLTLGLPAGGVTRLSLLLPEPDIEARIDGGVVTEAVAEGQGTRVTGYLDAAGALDVAWSRALRHAEDADVRTEARVHTVVTVGQGLVQGLAVIDVAVRSGEIDQVGLRLQEGVEVLDVSGAAVLQWRTDAEDRRAVDVLLKHLVADETRVAVRFQHPTPDEAVAPLRGVLPADGVPVTGVLGVQAPAGLDIAVDRAEGAERLGVRELPAELTALTTKPLLFGFRFAGPPDIALKVSRHSEVTLTSTLIDEVQASTVLLSDGTEVTKLRLDIRNNTRQYLRVDLPPGTSLTHALLDGRPVRPAEAEAGAPGALLFSLRQSERIAPGDQRTHVVGHGDTLGDLAHRYYADPGRWPLILDANYDTLRGGSTIQVGQTLVIPSADPLTVEESAFVLELAFEGRAGGDLGAFGERDLRLPAMDVDAMKVVWHLYLPVDLEPLAFDANLVQYTGVRYGLLRRIRDFLGEALTPAPASAGGDYKSILVRRKGIYQQEAERKGLAEVAPATFPLAGARYRFKRVLLDEAPPHISVAYVSSTAGDALRALAFLVAFALCLWCLRPGAPWWAWLIAGAAGLGMLLGAHYLLGVHRLLLWAVIAAEGVALLGLWRRRGGQGLGRALSEPWRLLELATIRNLATAVLLLLAVRLVLDRPGLGPLVAAALLFVAWRRERRAAITSEAARA